ncbi:MAG: hypothetical protein EBR28_04080 [Planctomycetia bacterium]|nr:hypothetical protein [Planctomycetia bacterium]
MRKAALTLAALACLVAAGARAGDSGRCSRCSPHAAGMETPYGDTGCGPRYCGAKHEPSCPDPCDACNRWHGRNGAVEGPEMLAPWQLPPGRGFVTAEHMGYDTRPRCFPCSR